MNDRDAQIHLWLGTPEAEALFDPARQSAADRARWAGLEGTRRRREWAVSRALLAAAGAAAAGSSSLSHSGDHAAVATGPASLSLGIDMEWVRPRDCLRLARFAFDPREHQLLAELPEARRLEHFYLSWTLKEAGAKALGLRLLEALRRCVILAEGDRMRLALPTSAPWTAHVFRPRPTLILSLVVLGERPQPPGLPRMPHHELPGGCACAWPGMLELSSASP